MLCPPLAYSTERFVLKSTHLGTGSVWLGFWGWMYVVVGGENRGGREKRREKEENSERKMVAGFGGRVSIP